MVRQNSRLNLASVPSVSGEQDLRSPRLLVSLHGIGDVLGFWEAPSVCFAGLLRLLLHCFGADNPTVRMSKLSMLFDLVFFMSLALGCVVPVVYSPLSPAVAPFMIVGINLFITKLPFIPIWLMSSSTDTCIEWSQVILSQIQSILIKFYDVNVWFLILESGS